MAAVPEQGVDEVRMDVAGRNRILDGTDHDGSERQDDERDEDTLDGVLDQTNGLLRVHYA